MFFFLITRATLGTLRRGVPGERVLGPRLGLFAATAAGDRPTRRRAVQGLIRRRRLISRGCGEDATGVAAAQLRLVPSGADQARRGTGPEAAGWASRRDDARRLPVGARGVGARVEAGIDTRPILFLSNFGRPFFGPLVH